MPKLPRVSSKELIKVLERNGFTRGPVKKGSHQSFVREDLPYPVTVITGKKQIPVGTLHFALTRAHKSHDEFIKILGEI